MSRLVQCDYAPCRDTAPESRSGRWLRLTLVNPAEQRLGESPELVFCSADHVGKWGVERALASDAPPAEIPESSR